MDGSLPKNSIITQWVNDFTHDLINWALLKTNDTTVAENLVQETFLAAIKSYDNFQNRSHPKTWLISILNHKIADYYSAKYKSTSNGFSISDAESLINSYYNEDDEWQKESFSHSWDEHHGPLLDNPEFIKVWETCINDLPTQWKEAIMAKYFFDKKSSEISQELSISMTNYWQYISRAKVLLKKCLEVHWN